MIYILVGLCAFLSILLALYYKKYKEARAITENFRQQRMPIEPATYNKADAIDTLKRIQLDNLFIPHSNIYQQLLGLMGFQEYYAKRGKASISQRAVTVAGDLLTLLQEYCKKTLENIKVTDNSNFHNDTLLFDVSLTLESKSNLAAMGRFAGQVLVQDYMDKPIQEGLVFECQFQPGEKVTFTQQMKIAAADIQFTGITDTNGNLRPEVLKGMLENGFRYQAKLADRVIFAKTVVIGKSQTNWEDEFRKIISQK